MKPVITLYGSGLEGKKRKRRKSKVPKEVKKAIKNSQKTNKQ